MTSSVGDMYENEGITHESVDEFFARYAGALSAVDLDELSRCYLYPSLAVSRSGTLAITDPGMTRTFFQQNAARYQDAGIDAVRIRNLRASYDEDGVWIGLADLENLDAHGDHVGSELNAYQLVAGDGRWAIAVTSPLDVRV